MRRIIILILLSIVFLSNLNIQVSAQEMNIQEWINEDNPEPKGEENDHKGSIKDSPEKNEKNRTQLVFNIIKTLFVLGLIIVLIYIVLRFINKNKSIQKHKVIDTLGGVPVGPSKSVQIIRIGDRFYIIGVGENIQMLDEITEPEVIRELTEQNDDDITMFQSTIGQFKQIIKKKENDRSFKDLFQNELKDMKENQEKARLDYEERNHDNE